MSTLRDEFTRIYQTQGELTPKLVVDEARKESHPLHSRFEWDDTIAGEKYREVQAAELIRSVRIKYVDRPDGDEKEVRAFQAIPRQDSRASNYMPIEEVAHDDFTRKLLLAAAEREWRSLRRRYAHLEEFMDMIRADVAGAA